MHDEARQRGIGSTARRSNDAHLPDSRRIFPAVACAMKVPSKLALVSQTDASMSCTGPPASKTRSAAMIEAAASIPRECLEHRDL